MKPLISAEEASTIITNSLVQLPTETISIDSALGRVLATDICADRDAPPFDRVMMDGIAISMYNHKLGSWRYQIIGTQAAGAKKMVLQKGEYAIEVMTGAPLPTDADAVIPVEQIDLQENYALPHEGLEVNDFQHIHKQGSDCKTGDTLIKAGTQLGANELAIAASVGATEIEVTRLPRIHLITTGDEVVPPSETPTDFQIRRSTALNKSDNDILILTGGISMGKFDWVAPLLEKLLGDPAFHGVAQRPGKPFAFWNKEQSPKVFALPGNPVSVMATMHHYVLPSLRSMLGIQQATHATLTTGETLPLL